MTGPGPRGAGQPPGPERPQTATRPAGDAQRSGPSERHAEEVLSQALRALAGSGRQSRVPPPETRRTGPIPFTPLQVALLAILLGLLIGMTAGVISLLG